MEFKELQEKIMENAYIYGKKYNVNIDDEEFALLKLYEEVGEFSQALLIHKKKSRPEKHVDESVSKEKMAEELADILGMTVVVCKVLGVDLETAVRKKWLKEKI